MAEDQDKWVPVNEKHRFGVVIFNFNGTFYSPYGLQVNVGDTLLIKLENGNWFYACKVNCKDEIGIVPKNYLSFKPWHAKRKSESYDTYPRETPVIQEVSSILHEWYTLWKQLYIESNKNFEAIRVMMYELIEMRSKIITSTLAMDELNSLKHDIALKIDYGNAILGLDMIVRDDQENVLNIDSTSVIDLFRAHEDTTRRIKQYMNGPLTGKRISDALKDQMYSQHNLFVVFNNFVCNIKEEYVDIIIQLFDAKEGTFISENWVVLWRGQELQQILDVSKNQRALFSDLGNNDLKREKVLLIFQVIRIGAMEFKENDPNQKKKTPNHSNKKPSESVRRPFGIAILDITEILNGKVISEIEDEHFVPFIPCLEKDYLELNIKRNCSLKRGEVMKDRKGQTISISLKLLHGDLNQVKEDYPHLVLPFSTLQIARKIGIPEVIVPGEFRNDLYLTLMSGDFNSAKSIEVTIKVCNNLERILPNKIEIGAGADLVSEYKSVVFYHEEKPKWMETIKISLEIEDFLNSHLKITFKHRSANESKDKNEKPFAFSFIKLMNEDGTSIKDQIYELLVYKIDYKRFDPLKSGLSYLQLPFSRSDLESKSSKSCSNLSSKSNLGDSVAGLTLLPKNVLVVSTILCSTKLTQNVDLLALLKYPSNKSDDELKIAIEKFMNVDGEDIVKFLQDILDSLFKILIRDSTELRDSIFAAIVYIISLVFDPKYTHFRQVLEVYIKKSFSAALAHIKLIDAMRAFFKNLAKGSRSTLLNGVKNVRVIRKGSHRDFSPGFDAFNVMRGLEYLFKFIVRSRCLFIESKRFTNSQVGDDDFVSSMDKLFNAMTSLMSPEKVNNQTVRELCLRYFPSAIPCILTVYDRVSLCRKITDLMNTILFEILKKEKLNYMLDIIHCEYLFEDKECRIILMPVITENIKFFLRNKEELSLCVQVLSDILQSLHFINIDEIEADIHDLTVSILRPVMDTVMKKDSDETWRPNLVAIFLGILRLMKPYHYEKYFKTIDKQEELQDFLVEIIKLFKDLISNPIYSNDWNEMIMLKNSIILSSLKQLASVIRERFIGTDFNKSLWNDFFHCAVSFLTQKSLQLECFSANKRTKILKQYNDMRMEAASEIRRMWFHLDSTAIFVPALIGLFLEMALIPDRTLRGEIIPIFFEMMQEEFYRNKNFKGCEEELITKIDEFIGSGKGDENFRILFRNEMKSRFENSIHFRKDGLKLVSLLDKLMSNLLEYRSVMNNTDNEDNEDKLMLCTVNLLEFYFKIGRQEMHLKYLIKLVDIHIACGNFTEAAFALRLHASSLKWSKESLPPWLKIEKYKDCRTQKELKEKLYEKAIEYFEKGQQWEEGISICEDLAHKYKKDTIDYQKLARLLKKESIFHENIVTKDRYFCGYYRVSYIGQGFPHFVRNEVFIHRSKPFEVREDFVRRLSSHFPNAIELNSLSPPTNEMKNSNLQYLQVNKVDPVTLLKEEFRNKLIHPNIKMFYESNQVQHFFESRIVDKDGSNLNEFSGKFKEKTFFTACYPFPGISTWFLVVNVRTVVLSPIENAIEDLETLKNDIIKHMYELHFKPNAKYDLLLSKIQGFVQPVVNGGIENYEKAFIESSDYPSNDAQVKKLKDTIASIVPIVEIAFLMIKTRLTAHYTPLYEHLNPIFSTMKKDLKRKYGKKYAPDELLEMNEIEMDKRNSCSSETRIKIEQPSTNSSEHWKILSVFNRQNLSASSSDLAHRTRWFDKENNASESNILINDNVFYSRESWDSIDRRRRNGPIRPRSNSSLISEHCTNDPNNSHNSLIKPPLPAKQSNHFASLRSPSDLSLSRYRGNSLPINKKPLPPPTDHQT